LWFRHLRHDTPLHLPTLRFALRRHILTSLPRWRHAATPLPPDYAMMISFIFAADDLLLPPSLRAATPSPCFSFEMMPLRR